MSLRDRVVPRTFGPAELYTLCVAGALLLAVAFYLKPTTAYLFAAGVLGAIVLMIPLRPFLYLIAAAFIVMRGSSYGLLVGDVSSLYSRGSGQFVFSLFELVVLVRLARELFGGRLQRFPVQVVRWSLLAIVVLYLTHVAVAFADGDVFAQSFDATGGRLLLMLAAIAWLTASGFRDAEDLTRFIRFVVLLATGLAAVGLFRYVYGPGDPANPYANISGLDVKLTWFEGGYAYALLLGLVALIAVPGARLTRRIGVDVVAGVAIAACLVLTVRRENWIAMVCAMALVFLLSRRGRVLAVVGTVATMFALGPLLVARGLSANASGVFGHSDEVRKQELILARRAIDATPLGQGPQGAYVGHPPNWLAPPTVVHDAFLWIGLKMGWPGAGLLLVLLVGAGVVALWAALRVRDAVCRPVAVALVAVYPYWVVTMVVGAPLLDPRLVGLFGLWLGMLGVVVRVTQQEQADAQEVDVRDPGREVVLAGASRGTGPRPGGVA